MDKESRRSATKKTPPAVRHVFPRQPAEGGLERLHRLLADNVYADFVAWAARQPEAKEAAKPSRE